MTEGACTPPRLAWANVGHISGARNNRVGQVAAVVGVVVGAGGGLGRDVLLGNPVSEPPLNVCAGYSGEPEHYATVQMMHPVHVKVHPV